MSSFVLLAALPCTAAQGFHLQFGMQNAAFACTTLRHAARLPTKIRAPHKGKFFLNMIEQPVALILYPFHSMLLPIHCAVHS
jgi:hypothetical protein